LDRAKATIARAFSPVRTLRKTGLRGAFVCVLTTIVDMSVFNCAVKLTEAPAALGFRARQGRASIEGPTSTW
jgi:hypothetical protein